MCPRSLEHEYRIGVIAPCTEEPSQDHEVYIYSLNQPTASLLAAASSPSEAGVGRLRDVASPARKAAAVDQNLATVTAPLDNATAALDESMWSHGTRRD